jgi:hypothetical protein
MKNFLPLLLLLVALSVNAQTTFQQYRVPFVQSGSYYVAATNISVPTNMVAKVAGYQYDGTATYTNVAPLGLQYPGDAVLWFYPTQAVGVSVLGPCAIKVSTGTLLVPPTTPVYVLLEFDVVNTTPQSIAAVQGPATTKSAILQVSTNLLAWTSVATNTTTTAGNYYKFFRVQLQ